MKRLFFVIILLCLPMVNGFADQEPDEWMSYLDGSVGKPPYYLYQQIMFGAFRNHQHYRALDLGAGAGDVAVDLAMKGWDVTVVDSSQRAGEIIDARMNYINGKFQFQHVDFEHMELSGEYDLVVSFFAFPFGSKDKFPEVIKKINYHTNSKAIVAMSLFGNEHTFVKNGSAFGMDKDELTDLLLANGFHIKYFLNRHYTQQDLKGSLITWDVLDVVAEKL